MSRQTLTIRRWCEVCRRWTPSRMTFYGEEVCAEHDEPDEDDAWEVDEDDDDE